MNTSNNVETSNERLAAAFNAAVDAEYPIPDNPHASVVQRAVDNRAAMWRGIKAAHSILGEPKGVSANPQRDLSAAALLKLWAQAQELATDTMPAPFQFAKLLLATPDNTEATGKLTPHTADIEQMLDESEQGATVHVEGNKLASFPLDEMAWDNKPDSMNVCRFNDWQLTLGDIRAAKAVAARTKTQPVSSIDTPEFRALTLKLIESANSMSEVSDAAHDALVSYVNRVKLAADSQAIRDALAKAARIARKYVGCEHIAEQILAIEHSLNPA